MEATRSYETSVDFYRTARRYNVEERTVQSSCWIWGFVMMTEYHSLREFLLGVTFKKTFFFTFCFAVVPDFFTTRIYKPHRLTQKL
jgi:hypothetical protein